MGFFNEECIGHDKAYFHNDLYIKNSGITYADPQYEITRDNASTTTVIEFIIEGQGYIEVGDKKYNVHRGDLYILRSLEAHHYYADKKSPYTKIWINVKGDFIDKLLSIYDLNYNPIICTCNVYDKIKDIHNILNNENKMQIKTLLPLALHKLVAEVALSYKNINNYTTVINNETLPNMAINYINAHIQDKFNLNDISKHFLVSKPKLIKIFKDEFGQTPYKYYLEQKLEFAKILLKNTDLSIEDISSRLNYSSRNHLTNSFIKKYNLTPVKYRNK